MEARSVFGSVAVIAAFALGTPALGQLFLFPPAPVCAGSVTDRNFELRIVANANGEVLVIYLAWAQQTSPGVWGIYAAHMLADHACWPYSGPMGP